MRFPRPAPAGALFAVVLVVPTVVVAPSFTGSRATPYPVSPEVQQVRLAGIDASALASAPVPEELASSWKEIGARSTAGATRAAQQPPVVMTEPIETEDFRMVGVTWTGAPPTKDGAVVVTARTRTDGQWTDWFDLHTMVDGGTEAAPNGRYATVPYWAGDSDGVQVRVDAVGAAEPKDVRADLIEPGSSDADAAITEPWSGSAASASTNRPPIVTRTQWGADESLRDKRLENNQTVDVAFVHHTAGSNNYSQRESPAVVRGLYSYYVNTLKYADMGYNFLVDKYGVIYEGRAGSVTKPVRGASTGGFNTDTMTVVAMGSFETAPPSDAMVRGIAKVLAYRLSRFHRDPLGSKVLTAEVGSSRYDVGERARFKVVSGHRDAGFTACPGQKLYNKMSTIRQLTAGYMGSSLVEPKISTTSIPAGSPVNVAVRSTVTQRQSWALTIREYCTGTLVRRITGEASPRNPIRTEWRGSTESGKPAPPGRYRLTLTSSGNGTSAWPYERSVQVGVGGRTTPSTSGSLARASAGTYVAQRPRTLVSSAAGIGSDRRLILGAGRSLDVPVLGRAGVPMSGVSAVAISVEAVCASKTTRIFVGPDGVPGSGARVLSLGSGSTARGFAIVRVGPQGGIRFRNQSGAVDIKASVVGYVSTEGAGGALTPLRRSPLGGASPLSVGSSPVSVDVAGRAGVPADARAVVLAIRRGGDSSIGSVWAWPGGGEQPVTPTWRRPRGTASVSQVIVPLGDTGGIRLATDRSGSVSLDVAGYVAATDSRAVHPVAPQPLLKGGATLGKGDASTVSVGGRAGVPSDATAAVIQLTGSATKDTGRLLLWPRGSSEPRSADLIVPKGGAAETLTVIRLGKGGDLRVRAESARLGANLTVLGWIR